MAYKRASVELFERLDALLRLNNRIETMVVLGVPGGTNFGTLYSDSLHFTHLTCYNSPCPMKSQKRRIILVGGAY